jgi:hypothetical protein
MSTEPYLHQIPFEMWVAYVEGTRVDIQTICGLTLKPEIPLNEKKPRCPLCWPPRRTNLPTPPALAKKYKARPVIIEAIQVDPYAQDQIVRVLDWGEQKSIPMAWLGEDRGLVVTLNGRSVPVPTMDYLVQDSNGQVLHLPPHLFWTMYEEVDE